MVDIQEPRRFGPPHAPKREEGLIPRGEKTTDPKEFLTLVLDKHPLKIEMRTKIAERDEDDDGNGKTYLISIATFESSSGENITYVEYNKKDSKGNPIYTDKMDPDTYRKYVKLITFNFLNNMDPVFNMFLGDIKYTDASGKEYDKAEFPKLKIELAPDALASEYFEDKEKEEHGEGLSRYLASKDKFSY